MDIQGIHALIVEFIDAWWPGPDFIALMPFSYN